MSIQRRRQRQKKLKQTNNKRTNNNNNQNHSYLWKEREKEKREKTTTKCGWIATQNSSEFSAHKTRAFSTAEIICVEAHGAQIRVCASASVCMLSLCILTCAWNIAGFRFWFFILFFVVWFLLFVSKFFEDSLRIAFWIIVCIFGERISHSHGNEYSCMHHPSHFCLQVIDS